MKSRLKIIIFILVILGSIAAYIYFKYFFTYEQSNITKRKIETFTGQNLTVTIFSYDGKIVKRWTGIKKITSAKESRDYTFFYTKENKYVQIPNSVWYLAEEE